MRADSSIHWESYPALLVAGAVALGIVLGATGWLRPSWTWVLGAGLAALLWAWATWDEQRRLVSLGMAGRIAAAGVLAISLGALRYAAFSAHPPNHLHRQAASILATGDTTTISGWVADAPVRTERSTRFTLRVDGWYARGQMRPAGRPVRATASPLGRT